MDIQLFTSASIYYYFPSKAELAAAVAKRYWEDSAAYFESLLRDSAKPLDALRRFPETFRWALANDNRICLCSFMSAQFDDVPDEVRKEVQTFTDVNTAWLKKVLIAAKIANPKEAEKRARAIYSAITGAQLMARSRKGCGTDEQAPNKEAACRNFAVVERGSTRRERRTVV